MNFSHSISGNWAGIIAIIMWSFANFIITLTQGIPSFLLGFFVMFFGGIILLSYEIKKGRKLQEIYRQSPFAYAITLFGIGGYILLHYLAFIAGGLIVTGCLTVNFRGIRKFLKRDQNDAI